MPEFESKEVESKEVAIIIDIPDECPVDFYDNKQKYVDSLAKVVAQSKTLVHDLSDEGRVKAKSDAAMLRKVAKTYKGFALGVFRSMSDKFKLFKDEVDGSCKELESEADNIMNRFDAIEKAKLSEIGLLVLDTFNAYRVEIGVKPEFQRKDVDFSSIVKLSGSLTPKGALTTKAIGFIKTVANGELHEQNRIEKRELLVEAACLREGINPPLSRVHFGTVFFANDEMFTEKLNELVSSEVERIKQIEARAKAKADADKKKEIDDALANQQAEANRISQENAKPVDAAPEQSRNLNIPQIKQQAEQKPVIQQEPVKTDKPVSMSQTGLSNGNEKKTVQITAVFTVSVARTVSDDGIISYFNKKLANADDLAKILNSVSVTNVGG
jgi:hypothetical protein